MIEELVAIQRDLKCPKSQRNKFGNYDYRSCEDILEAVKPLLAEHQCTLTLTDSIEEHGGRVYVVACATLTNSQGNFVSTKGYAREEEDKKGMDAAQMTGSASSYARKYALNGLFAIDDSKDVDAQTPEQTKKGKRDKNVEAEWIKKIEAAQTTAEIRDIYASAPSELKTANSPLWLASVARNGELQ